MTHEECVEKLLFFIAYELEVLIRFQCSSAMGDRIWEEYREIKHERNHN